jgi:hypothetical protein
MKKSIALALALVALGGAAFAQLRLDAGVIMPVRVSVALDGSSLEIGSDVGNFLAGTLFPFPEGAAHFQFDLGTVKLGVGARAFTFILETIIWPNAFAEVDLGPVVLEAQLGGGAFLLFGLVSKAQLGEVFFPDLSAWFKIGAKRSIRLGGGVIGLYLPDQTSRLPLTFYLGGKIALVF